MCCKSYWKNNSRDSIPIFLWLTSSHCLPFFSNVTIDPKHYFLKKKKKGVGDVFCDSWKKKISTRGSQTYECSIVCMVVNALWALLLVKKIRVLSLGKWLIFCSTTINPAWSALRMVTAPLLNEWLYTNPLHLWE